MMVRETEEQGRKLMRIDDIIIDTKETVNKAENEIRIAENESKKNTKKICCLVWMIIFVVLAIVLLVYFALK